MAGSPDPLAAKRAAMREEFFAKLFLLGGWLGTDTYKRTMWTAVPEISLARAAYSLTFRKPLPEPGAGNQLIMAGHEAMLAQWFHRPLRRSDIELIARVVAAAFPNAGLPRGIVGRGARAIDRRRCSLAHRYLGVPRRAGVSRRGAMPRLRRARRPRFLLRTGHVPLLRPGDSGDQGSAHETRRRRATPSSDSAPRQSKPATSFCYWLVTLAAAANLRPATPRSSFTPNSSSRSAPSATSSSVPANRSTARWPRPNTK